MKTFLLNKEVFVFLIGEGVPLLFCTQVYVSLSVIIAKMLLMAGKLHRFLGTNKRVRDEKSSWLIR